jgi:phosphoglycolate phosphatase
MPPFARFRALLADFYAGRPPIALPGAESALQTLRGRGIKIALTTGFDDEVAYPLLDSLGWSLGPDGLLDTVVTTTDVRAGRPAPYMIHRAMERTGAQDVRAVLSAGDTLVDVQAANQGGVLSVGVLTGSLTAEDFASAAPDYVLSSAADVPTLRETQPG